MGARESSAAGLFRTLGFVLKRRNIVKRTVETEIGTTLVRLAHSFISAAFRKYGASGTKGVRVVKIFMCILC